MVGKNKNFTSRWSKRKSDARRTEESGEPDDGSITVDSGNGDVANQEIAETTAPPGEELLTEEDFSDVDFDALDKSSDYTRFIKANVPAAIQKKALRKLWASDKVFEVLDGMNDYDEDFTVDGLAGKAFKSAYKIGRGYLSKEEVQEEIADDDDIQTAGVEEEAQETGSSEVDQSLADTNSEDDTV